MQHSDCTRSLNNNNISRLLERGSALEGVVASLLANKNSSGRGKLEPLELACLRMTVLDLLGLAVAPVSCALSKVVIIDEVTTTGE